MCVANQLTGIWRLGRKPDLSVATPRQRDAIREICPPRPLVGDQFACERSELAANGLPVRDEPGGGQLRGADLAMPSAGGAQAGGKTGFPFFSLAKWRAERPPMPPPRRGPELRPPALYDLIAPSVYVVLASDHAIELAERVPRAQGGAVAVTGSVLVTNCHVIDGRPQIMLSQHGRASRAHLLYADPGGDRCFLRSDMPVNPVVGVRRYDDLRIGEPVYSLGAPLGLESHFGAGTISGFPRLEGVRIIQNSAPTAHGSSGGGLFDARGNFIGVTTAISTIHQDKNYSIAAEDFWP